MVLLGILAWIRLILGPQVAMERLRQGMRWIEWRPVPHDLPRHLLLFLGAGLMGQMLLAFWATRNGYLGETLRLPMLFGALALFQGLAAGVILVRLRAFRIGFQQIFAWRPFRDISPLPNGALSYILTLPVLLLAALSTQGIFRWLEIPFERQPIFDKLGANLPLFHLLALFFLIAVLVPFCEELLFRGVVFPWLAARFGAVAGLVVHSLLFAAIHQHLATLVPLFVLSICLGLAYAYYRNLGVVVWLHGLFNGVNLLHFFLSPLDLP